MANTIPPVGSPPAKRTETLAAHKGPTEVFTPSGERAAEPGIARGLPEPPRVARALKAHNVRNALEVAGAISGAVVRGIFHAATGLLTGHPAPPSPPELSLDDIRKLPEHQWVVPGRAAQLNRLQHETFDVLVIGGGATGSGSALEAATRGLKTAMVEYGDFASGTSSRSTKLIHGGVRYLETAVKKLDKTEYDLVHEGLQERKNFLHMAPHLTDELRLVTPCYKLWEIPYYTAGLTLYDWIAGRENLHATRILGRKAVAEQLPGVKQEGLKGAVAYSDGEFNDARMNVSLATTAAAHGAAVANYVEVVGLAKENGKVVGAEVRDRRSGESWTVRAKTVINATGPFIDKLRKMDDPATPDMVAPSAGTHIFVSKLQLSEGVLVPKAPNGSVAFFKPFEGGTLIGTTEEKTDVTFEPQTTEQQVEYLRTLANQYLDATHQIQPEDITSVWTGIRPLVRDPAETAKGTVSLARNHVVDVAKSGLITIGGGKWTSFSRMGQDVVDRAIHEGHLPDEPTQRLQSQVIGAAGYTPKLAEKLRAGYGLDADVAEHLARSYGNRALMVADLAKEGLGARLDSKHPYLEAEVVYAARDEYAVDPTDVLSRRTRLSFIDEAATRRALPRVVQLLAGELGWDAKTADAQLAQAQAFYARSGMAGVANGATG